VLGDRVWGDNRVYDLLDGAHLEDLGDGVMRAIEARGPSWYEQKTLAYDRGEPEMMLDAIQLDMAVERMTDMAARAAVQLRMLGWDYQDIGAVVRDRRRRTGAGLVESGVRAIVRHEKRRSYRG
jgi:hypothetical protein